jgi:iron(III) transport system permease protein
MSAAPADITEKPRTDWLPYATAGLSVVVLVGVLIYPIFTTLINSFIKDGQATAISNLTLYNFWAILKSSTYRSAIWHSLVVAVLSSLFAVLLALPMAYCMTRVKMPFRNFIMSLSVIPIISPPFIGAYSWVILLGRSGLITRLINSVLGENVMPGIYGPIGIILALSLHYFPYVFLIVQGALAASDPYIEESAEIMGAGRWYRIRTLTFPLVLPSIGAGTLIVFVKALGNFGVPAILGGNYQVLTTLMYFQVHGMFNLNAASAIALFNVFFTALAVIILHHITRRQFITVTGVSRRARQINTFGAKAIANIYVWTLLLVALLPQIVVLFTSFAERWGGAVFPTVYGLGNYIEIFSTSLRPIINSVLLASGATILCTVFGVLAAYTTQRKHFRGKWAIDITIMLPFVLPGIVTGVAFLTTFNSGYVILTGTAAILVLAYFIRRLAYTFRSISAAISQVDNKMEEASKIVGATWGTTMRKITIPLVAPGILAGAILVFSTLITEMSVTIMLYSARWKTISIAIFEKLTGEEVYAACAIGSIAIVLTLVLVFTSSKIIGKSMADMFQ